MNGGLQPSMGLMAGGAVVAAVIPHTNGAAGAQPGPVKRRPGRPKIERVPETGERWLPPIVTVFLGSQGGLYHTRCRQRIDYRGTRSGIEIDFYCVNCREHVTLPEGVLPRIPVAQVGAS